MIVRTVLAAIATVLFATPALASPDLEVDILPPPLVYAYDYADYEITVTNIGNHKVADVTLTIELPETDTPQVEVLGIVGSMDSRCAASGTQIVCSMDSISSGDVEYPWFELALPWADRALAVTATVTSSEADTPTATINIDTEVGALAYYGVQVQPGQAPTDACLPFWPQSYSSYFECTIAPGLPMFGSWSFAGNGDIWIAGVPGVVGSWSQPASNRLVYTYDHGGLMGLEQFEGWGTSPSCFEGISSYSDGVVHPRRICF